MLHGYDVETVLRSFAVMSYNAVERADPVVLSVWDRRGVILSQRY